MKRWLHHVRLPQFARRSLLRVLVVAPGEPAVLMQLGKACKHLGLLEEAVRIVWLVWREWHIARRPAAAALHCRLHTSMLRWGVGAPLISSPT